MKTSSKKSSRSGVRSTSAKSKKNTSASRQSARSRSARTKNKSSRSKTSPKASSGSKAKTMQDHPDAMKKLFHEILKDTLNAEKQLVKALPKMAKGATSKQLSSAINKHLSETEKHVKRLEKVFAICDLKIAGKKCEAMEGLIKEGKEALYENPKGSLVRDVAIIVAAQKVEHYEMAAYGSLRSIAEVCGFPKAAELLQQTLDEEGAADKKLTEISETLNPKASETTSSATSKSSAKSNSNSKSASTSKAEKDEDESEDIEEAVYMQDDRDDEEDEDDNDRYDEGDDEEDEEDEEEEETTPGMGKTL